MVFNELKEGKLCFFNRKEFVEWNFMDVGFVEEIISKKEGGVGARVENFFFPGRF